jgi:hypothetical protein
MSGAQTPGSCLMLIADAYKCPTCGSSHMNSNARRQHERAKHGPRRAERTAGRGEPP